MEIKSIEIRDQGTCILAVAMKMLPDTEKQRWMMRRCGYNFQNPSIVLMRLSDQRATNDPYGWPAGSRTMALAHDWLCRHFDEIADGAVVDVEFIMGWKPAPKRSEQEEMQ